MQDSLRCSMKSEIEAYDSKMSAYFDESFERLRECYRSNNSEEFKVEYLKLSDEKRRFQKYMYSLRDIASTETSRDNNKDFDLKDKYITPEDNWNGLSLDSVTSIATESSCSVVAVAACYTQYYEEMITYFNKLLNAIERNNIDICSSPGGEDASTLKVFDEDSVSLRLGDSDCCSDPHAIMEQYFERYGVQGKWDWVSWNNYLSWIARTYPRWYNIFMECSRSFGIDWREMYSRWSHSDTSGEHSLPVYAYPVVTDDNSVGLQGGFLYEGDDPSDELYCQTCKQRFATERMFSIHLRAVTHTQNVLLSASKCVTVSDPVEEKMPLYENGQESFQHSRYEAYPGSEFIQPGTFFCELCQVSSMSQISLRYHLTGRLHKENVAIYYQTGDVSQLLQKRPPRPKIDIRLQPLLDVCIKPLVGLHYITEFQFTGDDSCVYACELCRQQFTQQETIAHVCSTSHRVAYFQLHYPELYVIVAHDRSDAKYRVLRVEYFSRKVEDFEGRKRMKAQRFSGYTPFLQQTRFWDQAHILDKKQELHQTEQLLPAGPTTGSPNSRGSESPPNDVEEGEVTEDSEDENNSRVNCTKSQSCSSRLDDPKAYEVHQTVPLTLDQETKEFIDVLEAEGFLKLNVEAVENLTEATLEDHLEYEADWALCRVHRIDEVPCLQQQSVGESALSNEPVNAEDQPPAEELYRNNPCEDSSGVTLSSQYSGNSRTLDTTVNMQLRVDGPHAPTSSILTCNNPANSLAPPTISVPSPHLGTNMYYSRANGSRTFTEQESIPHGPWRRQYAKPTNNHLTPIRPIAFTGVRADWRFPRDEHQPMNCMAEPGRPRLACHPMLPPVKTFPENSGYPGAPCEPNRLFPIPFSLNDQESLHQSDAMFDGYALYSRRGDRKARRVSEAPPVRFPMPRKMPRGGSSGGRKLSAIADFLGINEPPAPRSSRDSVPLTSTAVGLPQPLGAPTLGQIRAPFHPSFYDPILYHDSSHRPLRFATLVPNGISVVSTHMANPIIPNTFVHPLNRMHGLFGNPTVLHRR